MGSVSPAMTAGAAASTDLRQKICCHARGAWGEAKDQCESNIMTPTTACLPTNSEMPRLRVLVAAHECTAPINAPAAARSAIMTGYSKLRYL